MDSRRTKGWFARAAVEVNSVATRRFWALFYALPTNIQELAVRSYRL